ncbi:MAG TPA: hypothetical protein VMU81_10570 [Acetobacteraceae bacterium]|nr:hypothetical protein [Acetobacteraceae bacterium]
MSASALSRLGLILLTVWGLAMVLPSFYRLVWPVASFGLTADNDGIVVDVIGPFDGNNVQSPAEAAGVVVGDRLDLRQMNCWHPRSSLCASLTVVLGGSAGLQDTLPGREIDLALLPRAGEPGRVVHLRAEVAPLDVAGRLVLLADTVVGILSTLAAAWLVWIRPGWVTWGFFFYFFWFNPGQTYTYYAILQSWPLLLLMAQVLGALATGAAFAGLLIFALHFPNAEPDEGWRRWKRLVLWVGVFIAVLRLSAGANLFGVPTEPLAEASYICGYVTDVAVLVLLLVRRRTLHPRNEQRMNWVIAGCAIGLPSFIFAEVCESTGWLQSAWGKAPSETVLGLVYLVQGVLGYFVWTAVRRQRVISVAIPLRHGTVTTMLTLALAVPVVFLHERVNEIREAFHLPEWVWPLVVAPAVMIALHRVHEVAVVLVDRVFNQAYHRARRGLEQAGHAVLATGSMSAIDQNLTEAPARSLRLTSAAVFRDLGGVLRRTDPVVGWADAALQQLQPDLDAPVMACLASRKPTRLAPEGWRRGLALSEDQAPCLAVPVFGWTGQAKAIALFGPHATGSDITRDECEMLETLALQAGRGYERIEVEMIRHELHDLRARLGDPIKVPPPVAG